MPNSIQVRKIKICQSIAAGCETGRAVAKNNGVSTEHILQLSVEMQKEGLILRHSRRMPGYARPVVVVALTALGQRMARLPTFDPATLSIKDLCNDLAYRQWKADMSRLAKQNGNYASVEA